MAGVTKQDIPEISIFMSDFWNFVKKYFIPEHSDTYWEELMHDAAELGHKYKEDRFVAHQINAYLDYLEEKQKGLKNEQRATQTGRNHGKNSAQAEAV